MALDGRESSGEAEIRIEDGNATAFERRRFEESKSRAFERAVAFALKRKVESALRTRARNFFLTFSLRRFSILCKFSARRLRRVKFPLYFVSVLIRTGALRPLFRRRFPNARRASPTAERPFFIETERWIIEIGRAD